jgi:hypothetical protein
MAGLAHGFFGKFRWALALGGGRAGLGHGAGFGDRPLAQASTVTPALVAPALFALVGGAIALTGVPTSPLACRLLTGSTAVARLRPCRQKPAFAAFEQTAAAARMTTAQGERSANLLTGQRQWVTV